jgi:thiamine-monophosphate kinase
VPHATPRAIGLTAIGRARHLPVPSRAGAEPGDALWVTGTLGVALAGYRALTGTGPRDAAAEAHFRRPVPRLGEGRALAPVVHAMMDVSDGLLLDATRLADASGVSISITSGAVPLCAALGPERAAGLRWGDDYELLFALPPGVDPPVAATRIGAVHARGAHPLLLDGAPPPADQSLGWQHTAPEAGQ